MNSAVIYLLVLILNYTYGRVAVKDDEEISAKIVNNNNNISVIKIEPFRAKTGNDTNETINEVNEKNVIAELPTYNKTQIDNANQIAIEKIKCINEKKNEIDELFDFLLDTNDTCKPEVKKEDNGTALILTPFIKQGKIEEARNACSVDKSLFLGFESYSGFLTVNETCDSHLFFWYFPVVKKPVNETPWIIWLQGGPGASSMTGLFDEIGPFRGSSFGTLSPNVHTWLQNHSLLFFDSPVGTGYSFTNNPNGFVKDRETYGAHLYNALDQFLQIFPELRIAPLFVAGESYGGKYVPALSIEIHNHKDLPEQNINFEGLMVGNGYIEPAMIYDIDRPFVYFGLLEPEQVQLIQPLLDAFHRDIDEGNSVGAKDKWNSIISLILLLTNQKHAYNFLHDELAVGKYLKFLQNSKTKRALHVGDINFSYVNLTVNQELNSDFLSNVTPLYETLLDYYRVLVYCGQLDQMLSCVMTSQSYRKWKWSAAEEFRNATRYPFLYNNKLAGYYKAGGRLTEAVIRGAGHMAPLDMPAQIQNLVTNWTHKKSISNLPSQVFSDKFIAAYAVEVANNGTTTESSTQPSNEVPVTQETTNNSLHYETSTHSGVDNEDSNSVINELTPNNLTVIYME